MGKYSKEKNYDNLIAFNVTRKEYKCPCCGKTYLLANCKLEKFELFGNWYLIVVWKHILDMLGIDCVQNVLSEGN